MLKEKYAYVYILANRKGGTIYVGITSSLIRRIYEHKEKKFEGFTKKFNIDRLVYYENFSSPIIAIAREKQLKKWNRAWKVRLIEKENPEWDDLYNTLI